MGGCDLALAACRRKNNGTQIFRILFKSQGESSILPKDNGTM